MASRTTPTWQHIRLLRARRPPGVTGDRAAVFASALEQSEQLMRAAAEVGAAARPLPLFYALSQAGRAIAAAFLPGDDWRLSGHGLHQAREQPRETPLLRRRFEPDKGKRSSFAGVAEAIGSDRLSAPVTLGAVWAAMPDLIALPQMPDLDPEWRRSLRAYRADWNADPEARPRLPLQLLLGLPVDPNPSLPLDMDALVAELEAHYPTAAGVANLPAFGAPPLYRQWAPTGESLPRFAWPEVPGSVGDLAIDPIAPDYRGKGIRVLLPKLPTGDFLSPLMLWWVLLFGLSTVARYDPELWVGALDLSKPQAVPIEAALDEALDALPELILEALTEY